MFIKIKHSVNFPVQVTTSKVIHIHIEATDSGFTQSLVVKVTRGAEATGSGFTQSLVVKVTRDAEATGSGFTSP